MLVRVYTDINNYTDFETNFTHIKEILNQTKQTFGEDFSDRLILNKHYVIGIENDDADGTVLNEEVLASDLSLFKKIIIIPATEGEDPITAAIALAATYAGGAVATGASMISVALGAGALASGTMSAIISVVATVVQIGISLGASIGLSALTSPDSNFGDDPARAQAKRNSNLFNAAPTITEQGGSVPICYGNPFCGGVLISSSLTSTDVKKP